MENYQREGMLGHGTYGKVYKAKHIVTGQTVALKKTILTTDEEGVPPTTLREVSILRSLQSPYVVRLEEVVHTESAKGKPTLILVFEFLDHDLKQFMASRYGKNIPIHPFLVKHFAFQILLGLKFCHANSIMHRDLKPQNLLVDVKTKTVKIADFGLGRVFSLPAARYTHDVITLWYRPPEILLGTKYYSTGVDMWSVGCILAEMCTSRPLFCGESEIEQLLAIFRLLGTPDEHVWPNIQQLRDWHVYPSWKPADLAGEIPQLADALGNDGLQLLQSMLMLDPAKRISAIDALKSPYFDDIRSQYIDKDGKETGVGAIGVRIPPLLPTAKAPPKHNLSEDSQSDWSV